MAILVTGMARAQHFDVELRTDKGPVAGSRITTGFYGDTQSVGVSVDAITGHQIFPAYLGDFAGGPYATANPGFQAFNGTFLAGETIHFRALGTLLHWTPASNAWVAAPAGVKLTLYGQIPSEVVIGYSSNPSLWADQYAYYQGGTRYDGQGITGPLTAAIDDVGGTGAFHSHLDWKISSSTGVPPVGAYMLTLELWSPTLVNGQPKYATSRPFHIIFERGLSAAQMQAAFASRISPPCAARSMSWTVGAHSCSANVGSVASGQSATATDSVDPATGSAVFACTNGHWGSATSASCSAPPAACGAQALSWAVGANLCSASVAAAPSGTSLVATDAVLPTTGSASFSCSDGRWSSPEQASCVVPPPASCNAQMMSWSVGSSVCTAAVASTSSGSNALATDTSQPTTGTASFSCSDGSWGMPANASCTTAPPGACTAGNGSCGDLPRSCTAQTLAWTVDAATCSAAAPNTASGGTLTLADTTQPNTGAATFACSQGAWSVPASASCTAQALACPSATLAWAAGSQTCAAAVPQSQSGTTLLASDNEGPASGTASFSCNNGLWSPPSSASCATVRPQPAARSPAPPWAPPVLLPWDKPNR